MIINCPSSSHQTTPPLQNELGEHEHTFFESSCPLDIDPSNFHEDLVVSRIPFHMYFVPQNLSSHSKHPLDDTTLCSSILDCTLVLNEDRSIDGVGVVEPTCRGIHVEHEGDLENPLAIGDHPYLSIPPLFFPGIFVDLSIPHFSCISSSIDAPIVDLSQDTTYVSPSSNNGEDQSFIKNPLDLSSALSGNPEGEHPSFSSTPLCDSSNHEHANQHPEFFDLGCHYLFTSSSYHDVDSLIINPSNPLVYKYPFVNKVKTQHTVEAL